MSATESTYEKLVRTNYMTHRTHPTEDNRTIRNLYSTLVGEIELLTKRKPAGQFLSDEEVISILTKFYKNSAENFRLTAELKYYEEVDELADYLPQSLSREELVQLGQDFLNSSTSVAIKDFLAYVASNSAGKTFDKKIAVEVLKQLTTTAAV